MASTPKGAKPAAKKKPAAEKKAAGVSAPTRSKIDWDAVERDYRTGKFTLRELTTSAGGDSAVSFSLNYIFEPEA